MDKEYKGYIRIASRSPFSVAYGVLDTKECFVRQLCVSHNIKFKVKKVFTNMYEPDYIYLFVKIRKKDELSFLKKCSQSNGIDLYDKRLYQIRRIITSYL